MKRVQIRCHNGKKKEQYEVVIVCECEEKAGIYSGGVEDGVASNWKCCEMVMVEI
jgi:hypothetical protein